MAYTVAFGGNFSQYPERVIAKYKDSTEQVDDKEIVLVPEYLPPESRDALIFTTSTHFLSNSSEKRTEFINALQKTSRNSQIIVILVKDKKKDVPKFKAFCEAQKIQLIECNAHPSAQEIAGAIASKRALVNASSEETPVQQNRGKRVEPVVLFTDKTIVAQPSSKSSPEKTAVSASSEENSELKLLIRYAQIELNRLTKEVSDNYFWGNGGRKIREIKAAIAQTDGSDEEKIAALKLALKIKRNACWDAIFKSKYNESESYRSAVQIKKLNPADRNQSYSPTKIRSSLASLTGYFLFNTKAQEARLKQLEATTNQSEIQDITSAFLRKV